MRTTKLALLGVVGAAIFASAGASAQEKEKLTEAQAVGVMLTANANEVQIGQMTAARTTNPAVRAYALKLLDEHLASNRDMLGIIERTGLTPAESPLRDQTFTEGNKELTELWSKTPGADLDKTFLTKAIEDHAKDLKIIDEKLMPSVTNADVKKAATSMRTMIAGHLEEACRLGTPMGVTSKDCAQRGTE